MVIQEGILLKKKFGQHFLRNQLIADKIVNSVTLNENSSVFEIGGGDGFLTRTILQKQLARLWVFEIDSDWATYLKNNIKDPRIIIFQQNILDVDFTEFDSYRPWILLSNLPYQVTFPILHLLVRHRDLLKEGVVMMQEEVAEKILKTHGRGYGFVSLYFQYYFDWKKLDKISPAAFTPPPKVYSRLLYFKPKAELQIIPEQERFWEFIKYCFRQPRRTLKNNLMQTHYQIQKIAEPILQMRAQQLRFDDFIKLWELIRV